MKLNMSVQQLLAIGIGANKSRQNDMQQMHVFKGNATVFRKVKMPVQIKTHCVSLWLVCEAPGHLATFQWANLLHDSCLSVGRVCMCFGVDVS